jgi:hypothetical protein
MNYEKCRVVREITDENGDRPTNIMTDGFICPICSKEISFDCDNYIELHDGMFICELCWQDIAKNNDGCAICGEVYYNDDIDVKVCAKCNDELV